MSLYGSRKVSLTKRISHFNLCGLNRLSSEIADPLDGKWTETANPAGSFR